MNEMTAFERLIADVADEVMGPSRPVDAAWVVQSARTLVPPSHWTEFVQRLQGGRIALPEGGLSMFSALKFVVAGVIVALFGGFLLAGVLTTQQGDMVTPAATTESPSPMTIDEVLPGVSLTVEEVEPGVFRVVDDGVRDLTKANGTDIVAGHDGSIWLLRPRRFLRLGTEVAQEWPMHLQERPHQLMDVEVGPDGTVWTVQEVQGGGYAILSFDGDDWTRHRDALDEAGVEVAPDGTVWSAWDASDLDDVQIIGYLDGDRWQPVGNLRDPDELLISGTGDIWAAAGMNTKSWVSKLYRLNEDRWQDTDRYVHQVAVGPDGTVWTNVGLVRPPVLSRFDGTEWQDWPLEDSPSKPMGRFSYGFEVAPDRSLWAGMARTDHEEDCAGGVGNFDGSTWSGYLPDLCVTAMDIADDGSVWLLAVDGPDDARSDLYVITPEAAAANE